MDERPDHPRSPAENYPGPDDDAGSSVAVPDAGASGDTASQHADSDDRVTSVGDAAAAFGPPLEQPNEPGTVMDQHEKRLRVESRERIDSPPAVDPQRAGSHTPEPQFAIADHEAQTDPPPDPPGMPRPLSHDADPGERRRAAGVDDRERRDDDRPSA
jgi:hypothetical protein